MAKDWIGNAKGIYMVLGASNHTDKEREERDYYATDPIAIDKLLTVEKPYKNIWECAAGGGHLARRLQDFGYYVMQSDIVSRYEECSEMDFFEMKELPIMCDILTNPPYKYAKEFVLHGLELVPNGRKVYMFLKLTFLEGKARYRELFSKFPPKVVYVSSERILCAKNAEFERMIAGGGSAVAYGWFVWEKGWDGDTIVKWI